MISPSSEHYHLIMVPTEKEKFTWSDAYEYQLENRSLPSKRELLFAMIMVPQYFNVGLLYWTKNELTSRKDYAEGIYKRLYRKIPQSDISLLAFLDRQVHAVNGANAARF